MKQKPSSERFASKELRSVRINTPAVLIYGGGEKEGEVRTYESKGLRNILREVEKLGENKRSDAEKDIKEGRVEYVLRISLDVACIFVNSKYILSSENF
jgi:hypothetical protein